MADKVGKVTSVSKKASKLQARDLDAGIDDSVASQGGDVFKVTHTHRFCPKKIDYNFILDL